MSIKRDDEKCLDLGPQDRAASRERVRRRTCRGCHDDAVAAELRQRPAVDFDDDVHHPFAVGLLDRGLVQGPVLPDHLAVDSDLDIERQPLFDHVIAVGNALHRAREVGRLRLCEKPDVAEVDAKQRNLCFASYLCGAQQGAVTAEDDHRFRTARAVRCVRNDSSTGEERGLQPRSQGRGRRSRPRRGIVRRREPRSRLRRARCGTRAERFGSRGSFRDGTGEITVVQRRRPSLQPKEILHISGRTRQRARDNSTDAQAQHSSQRERR